MVSTIPNFWPALCLLSKRDLWPSPSPKPTNTDDFHSFKESKHPFFDIFSLLFIFLNLYAKLINIFSLWKKRHFYYCIPPHIFPDSLFSAYMSVRLEKRWTKKVHAKEKEEHEHGIYAIIPVILLRTVQTYKSGKHIALSQTLHSVCPPTSKAEEKKKRNPDKLGWGGKGYTIEEESERCECLYLHRQIGNK